jgi:dCMP deaminase
MEIPSWDKYFLMICDVVKLRSKDPKRQVGSCLVSDDNRILSSGYNGLMSGSNDDIDWSNRDLVHSLVLHSESNTLLYNTTKISNTKLYSSTSPCTECIKLIACAQVKKIIFKEKYKDFEKVKKICEFYNIEIIQHN